MTLGGYSLKGHGHRGQSSKFYDSVPVDPWKFVEIQSFDLDDLGLLKQQPLQVTLEVTMEPILRRHFGDVPSPSSTTRGKAILVNCAGTTGQIGRNPTSLQAIQQAIDLNLTSKTWLTSTFIEHCEQSKTYDETTVVNISSMCAVKPTPTGPGAFSRL